MRPSTRRLLVRATALAAAGCIAWLGASLFVCYRMTRRAAPPRSEPPPAADWAPVREVRLTTADGEHLGAWEFEGRADAPAVVLLHGNGGSRGGCVAAAEIVCRAGCTALAVTARAHGDSSGDVNDFGWSAAADVVAAVEHLERARPGRAVLVRGSSLGAAAAVFAAKRLGERVSGYLLESPYADLHTATSNRLRMRLPAPLAAVAETGIAWTAPLVLPDADAIAPVRAIRDVPSSVPVLVLAGGADRHATPEEAEALCAAAGPHARLELFPSAGHQGMRDADPERYAALLRAFVGAR